MSTRNVADDDLPVGRVLTRREVLRLAGAAGVALTVGGNAVLRAETGEPIDLVASPELTEGPFFVDERLDRSDLIADTTRASVVKGVPLTLNLRVFEVQNGKGTPLGGAQVDIWHCDTIGVYSDEVSNAIQNEDTKGQTWLRGYQIADADGAVSFRTIYPGWYIGRAVHVHFKVRATSAGKGTHEFTSQFFFNDTLSDAVFTNAAYGNRGARRIRNVNDGIYRDRGTDGSAAGAQLTLRPVRASAGKGYTADFNIGIDRRRPARPQFGGPPLF